MGHTGRSFPIRRSEIQAGTWHSALEDHAPLFPSRHAWRPGSIEWSGWIIWCKPSCKSLLASNPAVQMPLVPCKGALFLHHMIKQYRADIRDCVSIIWDSIHITRCILARLWAWYISWPHQIAQRQGGNELGQWNAQKEVGQIVQFNSLQASPEEMAAESTFHLLSRHRSATRWQWSSRMCCAFNGGSWSFLAASFPFQSSPAMLCE